MLASQGHAGGQGITQDMTLQTTGASRSKDESRDIAGHKECMSSCIRLAGLPSPLHDLHMLHKLMSS